MIPAYVQQALEAPLQARANAAEAEVQAIAERDQVCLFAALLEQWRRDRDVEQELPL